MIYFAHAIGTDLVKIGFTAGEPAKRLKELQTGCPQRLELLAAIEGTEADEGRWHKDFERDRTHGEWFKLTPRMMLAIARAEVRAQIGTCKQTAEQKQHFDFGEGHQPDVLQELSREAANQWDIAATDDARRNWDKVYHALQAVQFFKLIQDGSRFALIEINFYKANRYSAIALGSVNCFPLLRKAIQLALGLQSDAVTPAVEIWCESRPVLQWTPDSGTLTCDYETLK